MDSFGSLFLLELHKFGFVGMCWHIIPSNSEENDTRWAYRKNYWFYPVLSAILFKNISYWAYTKKFTSYTPIF